MQIRAPLEVCNKIARLCRSHAGCSGAFLSENLSENGIIIQLEVAAYYSAYTLVSKLNTKSKSSI